MEMNRSTIKNFSIGVNYWPVRKAMYFWRQFDPGEIRDDMALMADTGLSPVRIFLLWEDFQPQAERMNMTALNRLAETARIADDHKIKLWVTLFTGHMSGFNWLPEWMIDPQRAGDVEFPVINGFTAYPFSLKNPYSNPVLQAAQKYHVREVTAVLRGHPALWGWDLGNAPSNCYRSEDQEQGRAWLQEMVAEIRRADNRPVTLGLQQADLEEQRGMGPADVAECCDLITMQVYPVYAPWARSKTDPLFPLYLAELTRWLSGGRDVWLAGFGISTGTDPLSVDEESAAVYAGEALEKLRLNGVRGALWGCFGDYASGLWGKPPFNEKVHERSLGLFRSDLSPKEVVAVLKRADRTAMESKPPFDWIDLGPEDYWERPAEHIIRLYRRFLTAQG